MTRVLVTADDFGLHEDLNRAIAEGVRAGTIHAVSVSTVGDAFDVDLLRELKTAGASIGAHLTWVDEPWITGGGGFDRLGLLRRLLLAPRAFGGALEREARAQIARLIDRGLAPTHLDSHQHVHVLPVLWPVVRRLAGEFSVPRIRIPWTPSLASTRGSPGGHVLRLLAAVRRRACRGSLPCIGIARSGHNTAERIAGELRGLAFPEVEMVAHPGRASDSLRGRYGHWGYDWEAESDLLDPVVWSTTLARAGCAPFQKSRLVAATVSSR